MLNPITGRKFPTETSPRDSRSESSSDLEIQNLSKKPRSIEINFRTTKNYKYQILETN